MKRRIVFCLLLLCSLSAMAQEIRFVQGIVLGNDGQRISGITVETEDASVQAVSRHDGTFEMRVPLSAKKLNVTNGKKQVSALIDGGYIVLNLNEPANKNSIAETSQPSAPIGVVVYTSCKSGIIAYRGVNPETGEELFNYGPLQGTEEIGDFLAVVHALTYMKTIKSKLPVFSDNEEVLSWVKKNKCKAQMPEDATEQLKKAVARSEKWLKDNYYKNALIKWNSDDWGKNPAFIEE